MVEDKILNRCFWWSEFESEWCSSDLVDEAVCFERMQRMRRRRYMIRFLPMLLLDFGHLHFRRQRVSRAGLTFEGGLALALSF